MTFSLKPKPQYVLRDLPIDDWTRASERAAREGTSLRSVLLAAIAEYGAGEAPPPIVPTHAPAVADSDDAKNGEALVLWLRRAGEILRTMGQNLEGGDLVALWEDKHRHQWRWTYSTVPGGRLHEVTVPKWGDLAEKLRELSRLRSETPQ